MKDSINLASKKKQSVLIDRRIFLGANIFFAVSFLLAASLIGYRLYLTSQLSTLKAQSEQIKSEINLDLEKKVKFLTIKERLSEAQKILGKRQDINSKLTVLADTVPSGVSVESFEGDENEFLIRVSAPNLADLNSLVEEKIQEYATEKQKGIKTVEMRSFKLDSDSLLYEAVFTIEFI